jgi:tetratricopeptide (TPR) repeat protein
MRDADWLARYLPERDNLLAALAWACRADDADVLARLVAALGLLDYFVNGSSTLLEFDVPGALLARASAPLRGDACVEFGWAQYMGGSRARGAELSEIALDAYREAGDEAGALRALSQLVRLYESGSGRPEKANDAWALRGQIDARRVPLRTTLFCAVATGMGPNGANRRGGRSWTDLIATAREAGFDTLAAVCRVNHTDEFLVNGQYDACEQVAKSYIDAGETRPRARAFIFGNRAEALMQLGREVEALDAARAAMRSYPDALYLLADTLALGAIRQGRLHDAGLLMGYIRAVRRARSQTPDPAEAKMSAENDAALAAAMPAAELERLLAAGAVMSSSELFALATKSATA